MEEVVVAQPTASLQDDARQPEQSVALPAVGAERETKVKFTDDTKFDERTWCVRDVKNINIEQTVTDAPELVVTAGDKIPQYPKRSIKVAERLALLRARLWHRNAYDRGGQSFVAECFAGAQCQANLEEDGDDVHMSSCYVWESDDLGDWIEVPFKAVDRSPLGGTQAAAAPTKHDYLPSAKADSISAATRNLPELPSGMWLMDTGCGRDLISAKGAKGLPKSNTKGLTFCAANGKTTTTECVQRACEQLEGGSVSPYVLQRTPHVISVGKRVMEEGCSFIWCSNSTPLLITKTGTQIPFMTVGNVPYLRVGNADMAAVPAVETMMPPVCQAAPASVRETSPASSAPDVSERVRSPSRSRTPLRSCLRVRTPSPIDIDEPTVEEILQLITDESTSGEGAELHTEAGPATSSAEVGIGSGEGDAAEQAISDQETGWETADAEVDPALSPGQRRKLREEALSVKHALTHLPKNPYCGACQQGKMRQYRAQTGAYQRITTRFGQIVTCDHMISRSVENQGLRGETNALTVKDLHTKLLMCYAVFTKSADEVEDALRHFKGTRRIDVVYSDNADELT